MFFTGCAADAAAADVSAADAAMCMRTDVSATGSYLIAEREGRTFCNMAFA